MGYTIKLLPVVHKDLRAAKKWYNDQKADLGEEFKSEVNKEIDYIGEFPEHYQQKYYELCVRGPLGHLYLSTCLFLWRLYLMLED